MTPTKNVSTARRKGSASVSTDSARAKGPQESLQEFFQSWRKNSKRSGVHFRPSFLKNDLDIKVAGLCNEIASKKPNAKEINTLLAVILVLINQHLLDHELEHYKEYLLRLQDAVKCYQVFNLLSMQPWSVAEAKFALNLISEKEKISVASQEVGISSEQVQQAFRSLESKYKEYLTVKFNDLLAKPSWSDTDHSAAVSLIKESRKTSGPGSVDFTSLQQLQNRVNHYNLLQQASNLIKQKIWLEQDFTSALNLLDTLQKLPTTLRDPAFGKLYNNARLRAEGLAAAYVTKKHWGEGDFDFSSFLLEVLQKLPLPAGKPQFAEFGSLNCRRSGKCFSTTTKTPAMGPA
jgi:hypothetical protein